MYANGLTKYNNETEYRPEDGLLREEAAKIIGQAFSVL
jgi:DNA-binding XRE family transcriptional regulator